MSDQKPICYWIFKTTAQEYDTVHHMADDMFYETRNGIFEVENYEIDEEEKPKELSIVGCSENFQSGLNFLRDRFYERWRNQISGTTLYYLGADDGNYGTIHVPGELSPHHTIGIADVYPFFYQKKCGQLFKSMDGVLQTMGIGNWPICLAALIYGFIFVEAECCFFYSPKHEQVKVCVEYAKKHDQNEFTEEHGTLITVANGRKFGELRFLW